MSGKRGLVAGLLLLGTISLAAEPEMNGFDLGNAVIPGEELACSWMDWRPPSLWKNLKIRKR